MRALVSCGLCSATGDGKVVGPDNGYQGAVAPTALEAAASAKHAPFAPAPERDVADAMLSKMACRRLTSVSSEMKYFGVRVGA